MAITEETRETAKKAGELARLYLRAFEDDIRDAISLSKECSYNRVLEYYSDAQKVKDVLETELGKLAKMSEAEVSKAWINIVDTRIEAAEEIVKNLKEKCGCK